MLPCNSSDFASRLIFILFVLLEKEDNLNLFSTLLTPKFYFVIKIYTKSAEENTRVIIF